MKKLLLLFILLPVITFAQNRDYFTYLDEFDHNIFAQPSSKSASNVQFDDDYGEPIYPVIFVKISPNQSEDLLVCFSEGPSADPCYEFFSVNNGNYEYIFSVAGMELFIPGNGFLYTTGHTNNMFDKHKKFKFTGTGVEEVPQPFYYVGLKTQTIENIQLYSDYNCTQKLAIVAANSNIEVVAAEYNETCGKFLIKTPFGLFGWWLLDLAYPGSQQIKGLYYAGD
ncbi:MAG: hypothetical protein JXR68_11355 [Bacteroidales bacterium]|nr:hypothetical protein [Bacteroidales bacterium]